LYQGKGESGTDDAEERSKKNLAGQEMDNRNKRRWGSSEPSRNGQRQGGGRWLKKEGQGREADCAQGGLLVVRRLRNRRRYLGETHVAQGGK